MMNNQTDNPSDSLSRLDLRKAHFIWILEGPIITFFTALTTGVFQTGFAIRLGCNNSLLGLLAGIGAITGALQLFGPNIMKLFPARKYFVSICSAGGRLMWLLIAIIPLVAPKHLWVASFLILYFISSAVTACTGATWIDWMGDLVPPESRGRFFGTRNLWGGLVGLVAPILGGFFFDYATKVSDWSITRTSGILFAVAAPFALMSGLCGYFSPDVPAKRSVDAEKTLIERFKAPLTNPKFRPALFFSLSVTVALSIAGQFFMVYQLSVLHQSYSTIQVLNAFSAVTGMLSMPLIGYLADKYGNKPILLLSCIITVIAPFLWCITYPDSYPGLWGTVNGHLNVSSTKLILIVVMVTSGIGWAGVGLTQFNTVIAAAPNEERTSYIAVNSTLNGILGGISPIIGGQLADALMFFHYPSTGMVRCSYHVLFLISGAMRIPMIYFALRLHEPQSRSAGYVLDQIRSSNPVSSFAAIAQLGKSSDRQSRVRAVKQLGRLKSSVAVEELVKALDDVSLNVREQAAASLGEIGDARAVEPLLGKLGEPGAGIEFEAAVALGKIGDQSALPALAAAIQLEGPIMRRLAAVEALGRINHPSAPDALIPLIDEPDPTLRTAAIKSLGEYPEAIRRPEMIARLMSRWTKETDPAALSALVDVFASTELPELAPCLLKFGDRQLSIITRREILNASGSLLGGQDSFYAYLALDGGMRDATVQKILTTLQRTLRRSSASGAMRAAVRVRQALASYESGSFGDTVIRLRDAAQLIDANSTSVPVSSRREALEIMAQRGNDGQNILPEDALFCVFVLRLMTQ